MTYLVHEHLQSAVVNLILLRQVAAHLRQQQLQNIKQATTHTRAQQQTDSYSSATGYQSEDSSTHAQNSKQQQQEEKEDEDSQGRWRWKRTH